MAPDSAAIDSVTVDPNYCHHCGSEVASKPFEGRECAWCPECDRFLVQKPVPIVQGVVHDGERILLLDEPISWKEDVLSLPGGHVKHDEGPGEAFVRELTEETGMERQPDDLDFLTIRHTEFPDQSFYLITYTLETDLSAGDLTAESDGFEVVLDPIDEVLADPDRLLPAAYERVEAAFE